MAKQVKFLYLSQEDISEAGVLEMDKCLRVIEGVFKLMAKGN